MFYSAGIQRLRRLLIFHKMMGSTLNRFRAANKNILPVKSKIKQEVLKVLRQESIQYGIDGNCILRFWLKARALNKPITALYYFQKPCCQRSHVGLSPGDIRVSHLEPRSQSQLQIEQLGEFAATLLKVSLKWATTTWAVFDKQFSPWKELCSLWLLSNPSIIHSFIHSFLKIKPNRKN